MDLSYFRVIFFIFEDKFFYKIQIKLWYALKTNYNINNVIQRSRTSRVSGWIVIRFLRYKHILALWAFLGQDSR